MGQVNVGRTEIWMSNLVCDYKKTIETEDFRKQEIEGNIGT
jgi:hypothetical protein